MSLRIAKQLPASGLPSIFFSSNRIETSLKMTQEKRHFRMIASSLALMFFLKNFEEEEMKLSQSEPFIPNTIATTQTITVLKSDWKRFTVFFFSKIFEQK